MVGWGQETPFTPSYLGPACISAQGYRGLATTALRPAAVLGAILATETKASLQVSWAAALEEAASTAPPDTVSVPPCATPLAPAARSQRRLSTDQQNVGAHAKPSPEKELLPHGRCSDLRTPRSPQPVSSAVWAPSNLRSPAGASCTELGLRGEIIENNLSRSKTGMGPRDLVHELGTHPTRRVGGRRILPP